MTEIPHPVRELAETPDRFTKMTPGFIERTDTGRYVLLVAPAWATVSAVTIEPAELEETIAEIRARTGDRNVMWWMGPSTRPADLYDRLAALGFVPPPDGVAELIAMAAVGPPEAAEADVRRVETFEDYEASAELRWAAFETPPDRQEQERKHMREIYERVMEAGAALHWIARVDGRVAATASAVVSDRGLLLFGGATAPWARGRGLYRALVRARWDEAVRRGTPALVTQANPATSAPILRRLGFVEVGRQRRLEDRP